MKIIISPIVRAKVNYWIKKAGNMEVSGMGTVTQDTVTGDFYFDDVFLVKQKNGSSSTDLDAESLSKLSFKLHQENRRESLKLWWHSHASMSVFWSGTDHIALDQLAESGWFLAVVFNNKNEYKACYTQGGIDGTPRIFLDDLKLEVGQQSAPEEWDKEYDDNVSKEVYKPITSLNNRDSYNLGIGYDLGMDESLQEELDAMSNNLAVCQAETPIKGASVKTKVKWLKKNSKIPASHVRRTLERYMEWWGGYPAYVEDLEEFFTYRDDYESVIFDKV